MLAFAQSNRPPLHRAYLVTVCRVLIPTGAWIEGRRQNLIPRDEDLMSTQQKNANDQALKWEKKVICFLPTLCYNVVFSRRPSMRRPDIKKFLLLRRESFINCLLFASFFSYLLQNLSYSEKKYFSQ